MVKKLISFLKSRIEWRLLFEAVAAAFFLWLAAQTSFAWWAVLVFGFWLVRVYFKHLPRMRDLWFSFLALAVLSVAGILQLSSIGPIGLIVLIFAAAFFILLGIANFLFKNNQAAYNLLNTLLIVGGFLIFFTMDFAWWRPIILGFFLLILFREVLNFHEVAWRRRSWIVGLTFAFIALELGAVVSFLPLGPLNAAAFLTLFLLLVRDAVLAFFQGRLELPVVFRQVTVFVALSIVIFAASTWSL